MIGSGILPLHLSIISPIWGTDGFHPTFRWLTHLISSGICNLRFLNGENILTPFGVLLQNLRLLTLLDALPSKVFPWGLGSSTLGFLIPDAPFVVNLSPFCIFSSFVSVLKIIGTEFMIFSSLLGPNYFHGT